MMLKGHNSNVSRTRSFVRLLLSVVVLLQLLQSTTMSLVSASVFMPYTTTTKTATSASAVAFHSSQQHLSKADLQNLRLAVRSRQQTLSLSSIDAMAMAIPGYGVAEQVIIGGFGNFLNIYNLVITARILLSWFPQAAGIGALQPIYAITDPYLNLFRNIIPPLFGLDFSPILAFFLLNVLTNATAAVGCEIPSAATMNTYAKRQYMYQHRGCNMLTSHEKPQDQNRRLVVFKMSRNI
jgi:uncharacterized protein YggT (Ycf19 family)